MRKYMLILPLLFAPVLAGAGHPSMQVEAAFELKARAAVFNRSVASLRGNRLLKREARDFLRVSKRIAKQSKRSRRPANSARALNILNNRFEDLRYAAAMSHAPPWVKRRMRRQLRFLSLAVLDLEFAMSRRGRLARNSSTAAYRSGRIDKARKRYRD